MIYLMILALSVLYGVVFTSMLVNPPRRRRTPSERHTRSQWYKL
jgi:hypothetical protein